MQKQLLVSSILALASYFAHGASFAQSARHVPVFPQIQKGQSSYVVQPRDADLDIDLLKLPKNFTLSVDHSVTSIKWRVGTIEFGPGATLDLSAPQAKPPTPPKKLQAHQADYCDPGIAGQNGTPGIKGVNGTDLTITGLKEIISNGSLWIRTDGGPGGDGGEGQDGQEGGGPQGGPAGCKSQGGGRRGDSGPFGAGGRVSEVTILYQNGTVPPLVNLSPAACGGPTSRPASTSVITIFGAPGCDGKAGGKGYPGRSG